MIETACSVRPPLDRTWLTARRYRSIPMLGLSHPSSQTRLTGRCATRSFAFALTVQMNDGLFKIVRPSCPARPLTAAVRALHPLRLHFSAAGDARLGWLGRDHGDPRPGRLRARPALDTRHGLQSRLRLALAARSARLRLVHGRRARDAGQPCARPSSRRARAARLARAALALALILVTSDRTCDIAEARGMAMRV